MKKTKKPKTFTIITKVHENVEKSKDEKRISEEHCVGLVVVLLRLHTREGSRNILRMPLPLTPSPMPREKSTLCASLSNYIHFH